MRVGHGREAMMKKSAEMLAYGGLVVAMLIAGIVVVRADGRPPAALHHASADVSFIQVN